MLHIGNFLQIALNSLRGKSTKNQIYDFSLVGVSVVELVGVASWQIGLSRQVLQLFVLGFISTLDWRGSNRLFGGWLNVLSTLVEVRS